jgi:hypothetical protein
MWSASFISLQVKRLNSYSVPILAQLAKENKDYAVLNLIRRPNPVITEEEYQQQFDGKTALGWAMVHGKKDLAEELQFKEALARKV